MSDTLQVDARSAVGKRANRKLRSTGSVPAVLYGHGEEPTNLSITIDHLRPVLRHHAKVVDLSGAVDGKAVIQDLQWDTFGRELLHVDLLRVIKGEKIHVTVPVEIKGEAPGSLAGGMLEQTLREVEIEAIPSNVPDQLHVDVSSLEVGGSLSVGDISDLPEGCVLVTAADTMAVHCIQPAGESDETDAAPTGAEPEVIGKKEEDES